ncbi:hypothetical protein KAFR_0H01630 [Kazachstania africana CBS 2517]|uniref:mRNA export factor GLE1 n=1 Tax=Kazachstania africana (strain ATCC 22294 / BCRC 22015 / CBS 2517 / CECT 1963 / NBRC 1671 / NRRL Y-8276) TaxID=1071382 RepID=H2AZ17_KAZAF|nr:hypothetical protein KAFR_0H01630 [Kazachstania africana CBS 2517]CCF59573.1 hypothetical protein KAFR_0H01630 [Kazachstania africana CBS 2517]
MSIFALQFRLDDLVVSSDDEDGNSQFLETISTPGSSPSKDSTFIYDFERSKDAVPQLKLPKTPKKDDVDMKLDEDLEELMHSLKLDSKMPLHLNESMASTFALSYLNTRNRPHDEKKLLTGVEVTDDKQQPTSRAKLEKVLDTMSSSITQKLAVLTKSNTSQIKKVKDYKLKLEQERKQKEDEERRRIELAKQRELEEAKQRRLREEAQRQKEEEERKRKEEELKQQQLKVKKEKELKLKQETERRQNEVAQNKYITNFDQVSKTFWHYKEKIVSIKRDVVEPVKKADKETRNILSKHKRKINPKFGQLTNSMSQLTAIATELDSLIAQTRDNDLCFKWILNFIAKAIVHQAETEVRVKPESSLPLAKLSLFLMGKFPDLIELLMARFVKKCPFVIGFTCSIDTEQGRFNMGWKRNSESKWEDGTVYDERMSGMMTLFAVITRLDPLLPNQQNPWSMEYSWKILARIANVDPKLLTNTHFVVLGSWWDAAASNFLQVFGNQGAKLLKLIGDDLTSSVAERKYVGAARLRILTEEWMTSNMIKSFPEMDQ